ncbi:sodium/potassium-transporting ATPase subunit beta-2 [Orussus abietinus]|uniref:sodium/potassium-transporting ATPase subunit beta-2 n=1 Tax=Orussus abietinus TaxID=222816 RepID=UPI0006267575|nr:sodium/potassium-transporting ATPase subunit beta-2 [Orussus abietinus]
MSVPGKEVKNGTYEFNDYMRAPDSRNRWEILQDALYNKKEGTYCGRSGKQWGITAVFYCVFFSCLAVFFAICMKGLLATLNEEKPRWILDSSIIGTNPGLGFRPVSDNEKEGALIWYSASNATQVQRWTGFLDTFLSDYINSTRLPTGGRNQQICSYTQAAKPGNVCAVNVNDWGPCSPQEGYGYNNSAPCVFVKLNRIYGWEPDCYNDSKDLPSEMPESLVRHIQTADKSWLNTIWVSCQGENPHDREVIGELEYYPKSQGFPSFYYPYVNTPGYLSPIVAVHFLRPKRSVIINVECRAWAKNIVYSNIKMEKKGAIHFELMIDD